MTTERYLLEWLAAVKPSLRPSTYKKYESALRLHVYPALGRLQLAKVSPQQVSRMYADLIEQGLASQSVVHVHRILHRALKNAVRWGVIARNVTDAVDPPRVVRREMQVLTPRQVRQLLSAEETAPLRPLLALAVATGMRQGELFALRWSDVDLRAAHLVVRRALVRAAAGGAEFAEPKTAGSTRRVELSTTAVDALREQWRRQQEDKRRASNRAWRDLDLVFTNRFGSPLNPQNTVQRQFYPLLEKLGLPKIRFHDLRHTAATLLLAAGVHPKIVSEMLGHSDTGITLDLYSHVIPGLHQRAAAAFDDLLAAEADGSDEASPYDGSASAVADLAVKLAVKPRSAKVKAQVSPRSSGDRASVS